jgi:hypothetical protein
MGRLMTSGSDRPGSIRRAAAVALTAVVGLLLVVLPTASAHWAYAPGDPIAWSNGEVLCEFAPSSALVAISAVNVQPSGLTASMVELAEAHADGSIVATADLAAANWSFENASTEDEFDLAYSVTVPITSAGGSAAPVGTVNVSVNFVLPAYEGSPAGASDTVAVEIGISGWTWQAPDDHLVLTMGAAPSFPDSSRVTAANETGWTVAGQANATGADQERLGVNSSATATAANGSKVPVGAAAALSLWSPQWATVTVSFAASAGEFASLAASARVGVVLPATIAGIPTPELVAAAGAAVLLSVLVAAGTRRLRRKPSSLVYAEDEP